MRHLDDMDVDTPLLSIIKEVCRIKQCSYRLIYTDCKIELKLSPNNSHENETNWIFENTYGDRISLKLQLFKHAKERKKEGAKL